MTAEIVLINVIETIEVNFMKLLKQAFVTVEITLQKLQGNSRVILKRKKNLRIEKFGTHKAYQNWMTFVSIGRAYM